MKTYLRSFTVEGLNLERLIRQAGEKDVALQGVRRDGARKLTGLVDEGSLETLREMADKGGWRFSEGRKHGLGRIEDFLRRRWALAVCLVLALSSAITASFAMWRVEIADAGVYEADIRAYLNEEGIRPLRWKASVDPAALRDALEWRYPKVAWVECGWRGVTLKIRVIEGVSAGDTLTHLGSADIVASRDGVVDSVVTVAGTPQVKAGDTVRKGQVLILGQERTSADATRPVSARGTVTARVWDGATVRMSAVRTETVYTGRTQETLTVVSPWFNLWAMPDSGFEHEDVSVRQLPLGGFLLPFSVRYETRMEATLHRKAADTEQIKAEAGVAAMRALRQKIGLGDDLVDKWVEYCMIEGDQLEATAFGERRLDIGVRQATAAP